MDKSKLFIARGKELNNEVTGGTSKRGKTMVTDMENHIDKFHSMSEIFDRDIEEMLLLEELRHLRNPKKLVYEKVASFSPSSADKCERELYYKAKRYDKDEKPFLPYHRRWTRNGSAIHAAVQKDLIYAQEHMKNPAFKVLRMDDGTIAWEHNLKDVYQVEHKGVRFQISGMMDGIMIYKDGKEVGFEFKTKSTTVAAIGDFTMKDIASSHKQQAIAYAIMFGVEEFIFMYESLAKDGWNKREEAKPDFRVFYFKPTEEEKTALLDKFARVATFIADGILPAAENPKNEKEFDEGFKCIFCPFKEQCETDNGYSQKVIDDIHAAKAERRDMAKQKRLAKAKK